LKTRKKSILTKYTVIDNTDLITMHRAGGRVVARVSFFERGVLKHIDFKLDRNDLGCIASQTRQVLRLMRDDLNRTIASVEEKV